MSTTTAEAGSTGKRSGEETDAVQRTSGTRRCVDGPSVLFVEDEPLAQDTFGRVLRRNGYDVCPALDLGEALQALRSGQFDVVLLDLLLPDISGAEALQSIRRCKPDLPIVVLTGADNPFVISETAMLRPFAFLHKPLKDNDELLDALSRAVAAGRAQRRTLAGFEAIVGETKAIRQVIEEAALHATSHTLPIMLVGETGTGKDLLAQCIHETGPRRDKPFVCIGSAGIAPSLAHSLLFGHVAGAFTGAIHCRPGRIREADSGTLLLNDIQNLSLELQATLLDAIETRTLCALGSTKPVTVDVRIIAATNQEPSRLLAQKRLLPDLYHRLAAVEIRIPALRDRREDIKNLTAHFVSTLEGGKWREVRVEPDAFEAMEMHPWPGNVRELRNTVAGALAKSQGRPICVEHLPFDRRSFPPMFRKQSVGLLAMEDALRRTSGRVDEAARILEMPVSTFYRKMRLANLDPRNYR